MASSFKDLFSGHAGDYSTYRPHYPAALFDGLAALAPARALAWDCGTGNGQAAVELSRRFAHVVATDPSEQQLRAAPSVENIDYRIAPAEASGLADRSADLVTVAQALHWFRFDDFFAEVRRVARPGALLAVWSYNLMSASPAVDAVVQRLYSEIVGPYWQPERRHVEDGYGSIAFPFNELVERALPQAQRAAMTAMTARWPLTHLFGYLQTWSAVRDYQKATGVDPVSAIGEALLAAWGDPAEARTVTWPLTLRIFAVP
jgi:SAM-dependent methyltransferase